MINKLKMIVLTDKSIIKEVVSINIHRIYMLSLVMAPVHLAHVMIFWLYTASGEGDAQKWRIGIIILHSVMIIIVSVIGVIAFSIKRKKKDTGKCGYIIQAIACLSYLLFGALVCAVDQYIAPTINPYLIACTGIAVTLLISPASAVIYYAIACILLYNAVAWTQQNLEFLLSVRVNGITAACVGFGVSFLLWRNSVLAIQQKRQIEEQKSILEEKNTQLEFLATHDPLTGLFNRIQFLHFAEKETARVLRSGKEACIILMDIDHFKKINDNFGHPVGDAVLKDIAKIITSLVRITDIPARLGGEEFIILLPETTLLGGAKVAEKLRLGIMKHPFSYGEKLLQITSSFGVALLTANGTEPLNTSYNKADEALYRAKKNGRNRVEIAAENNIPI